MCEPGLVFETKIHPQYSLENVVLIFVLVVSLVLPKFQRYHIRLCSKFVNEGGEGATNSQNLVNVVYGCHLFV